MIGKVSAIALLLVTTGAFAGRCSLDDAVWSSLTGVQKKQVFTAPDLAHLDEACFEQLLMRCGNSVDISDTVPGEWLRRYSALHPSCGYRVLVRAWTSGVARRDLPGWKRAIALWEKQQGPLRFTAAQLQQTGQFADADSIMRVLESAGRLDAVDYLQWGRIKGVMGENAGAVDAWCHGLRSEPRLQPILQNQIAYALAEMDADTAAAMARSFARCASMAPALDTLSFRRWLADLYDRYGLYDDESAVLANMGTASPNGGIELLSLAADFFSRGLYQRVLMPAHWCWERAAPDLRAQAASLLYQAYAGLGRGDSALVWLPRADLNDAAGLCRAVVLYQNANLFDKSDSILSRLPPSAAKDTLEIRQALFEGKNREAADKAAALVRLPRWVGHSEEARWCLARARLFSGDAAGAGSTLDSIKIRPEWPQATEALRYRFLFARLSQWPEAAVAWGKIAYSGYIGRPQKSILKQSAGYPREVREILAVMLANSLVAVDSISAALDIMQPPDSAASPEYRYCHGDLLLRAGRVAQAREVLQQLVLDRPGDVFAQRARVLLAENAKK